jgi:hypothetical protein
MPVSASRRSCQATIAPPAPSLTMIGVNCPPAAVVSASESPRRARPWSGQAASTSPVARTCWAKMLTRGLRRSCQAMIAPSAPSVAITGCCCALRSSQTALPNGAHAARPSRGVTVERSRAPASATTTRCDRELGNMGSPAGGNAGSPLAVKGGRDGRADHRPSRQEIPGRVSAGRRSLRRNRPAGSTRSAYRRDHRRGRRPTRRRSP